MSEDYPQTGLPTVDGDTRLKGDSQSLIHKRPAEVGTAFLGALFTLIGLIVGWSLEIQAAVTTLVMLTPAVISTYVDKHRQT